MTGAANGQRLRAFPEMWTLVCAGPDAQAEEGDCQGLGLQGLEVLLRDPAPPPQRFPKNICKPSGSHRPCITVTLSLLLTPPTHTPPSRSLLALQQGQSTLPCRSGSVNTVPASRGTARASATTCPGPARHWHPVTSVLCSIPHTVAPQSTAAQLCPQWGAGRPGSTGPRSSSKTWQEPGGVRQNRFQVSTRSQAEGSTPAGISNHAGRGGEQGPG